MIGLKEGSYLCSQITGGVENGVPLHIVIPFTSGRGSDLLFEAVPHKYLQFP
jgi:hypothetical protein